MSGSFPIFDGVVETLIGWMAPELALDIGAGEGKYGRMIARATPSCAIAAIEVHSEYIQRFDLHSLYARVEHVDATQWWRDNADETFDVVVAGNLLQMLPKSAGLDLINALVYRCAWLVLLLPEFVIQGALDGTAANVHRAVWSERDLHWHDLWAWDNTRSTTLALLRGYQPSALTIDELVRRVNEGALPVRDFDGQTVVRNCRLRLVDHSREVAYRPR
ncbi:MAG: class I SAM-dependent methyltransferase [Burkholderiaceae bacterium]